MAQEWYLITSPYDISDDDSEINGYSSYTYQEFVDGSPERYLIGIRDEVPNYYIVQKKKDGSYQLLTPPNKVNTGDYITYKNNKWIVATKYPDDNKIWQTTEIKILDHTLKFIDKKGILCELPIIATIKNTASDSMQEGKIINTLENVLEITCQDNEISRKLITDKRIIFDKKAWKVVDDNGTTKGLLVITSKKDEIDNVHDDLVNQIADAFSDNPIPTPTPIPSPDPTITYEISSSSATLFDVKRFNTNTFSIIKKVNGVEDTAASFNITIDYNSNATTIATLTVIDAKSCKVKNNTGINNEIINIKFTDSASGVITTQQVRMVR